MCLGVMVTACKRTSEAYLSPVGENHSMFCFVSKSFFFLHSALYYGKAVISNN